MGFAMPSLSISAWSTPTMLVARGELLPYRDDFYLWKYIPSMPAGIIFLIIFLALSAAHTWKMIQTRLWFCLPFVIGGYLEAIGMLGRILATNATDQLMPYIIQSVFLLVPPSLFAASIYMTLGRVMTGLGPRAEACSLVRVKWLTKIFVIGDAFAFIVQSSGAGYMAGASDPKMGEYIVISGLFIQIIFFGLFVFVAVIFDRRYRRITASGTQSASTSHLAYSGGAIQAAPFDWKKLMLMMYATSALILVRCVFRIIEYVMGADAYLLSNEWTLYIFDLLLMAAAMVLFYIWYPSQIQPFNRISEPSGIEMRYEQTKVHSVSR